MRKNGGISADVEERVQSQFVNRVEELSRFNELLKSKKPIEVFSIYGEGGVGKTWFTLHALQQASMNGRVKCTKPIDFYVTQYHSVNGVRDDLYQQLGKEHFEVYEGAVHDLLLGREAGQSAETLATLEDRLQSAFIECYNKLAERWDKVLLSFDTFEVVQDETVGHWLINDFLPMLKRTAVVLSGRKNKSIDWGILANTLTPVELGEIHADDAYQYFNRKGITDVPETAIKRLWEKTRGRPLMMDLVVDWLKENVQYENLIDTPKDQFEQELVGKILAQKEPRHRAILYMAWAHRRLDLAMLKWLMQDDSIDYEALINDLTALSFVKYREPINSILLHDEMRDLVVQYVWGVVDPSATERIALSQRIIDYYDQFLIPEATNETKLQSLRAEELFFTLYLDLGKGYEHFTEVFDKLFSYQNYDYCEVLLIEIGFYRDRLPLEQIGELELRRAKLLLQRNRLGEAETVILRSLDKYQESILKIAMLVELGSIYSRRNQLKDALRYCEEANEIGEHIQIDSNAKAIIENRLGYFYRLLGKWDAAIEIYSKALEKATDPNVISNILNAIGYIHALKTDYDSAQEYCEEGLKMRERLGMKRSQGLSWSTLGEVCRYKGKYKEALDAYERALRIFTDGNDQENIARILQQRGVCYVEMGEYIEANNDLINSLSFYVSSTNKRDYPRCLERLGRLYFAVGDYSQAHQYFEKAYKEAEEFDIDTAVYCIVWMARLAFTEDAPAETIASYVDHLKSLVEEHGYQNPQHLGQINIILGHALFRDGVYENVLELYANGMAEIAAQRRGDYLIKSNLNDIESRLSNLLPEVIIEWTQTFRHRWQDPHIATMHPELVRFCDIKEHLARTRLAGRSGQ